MQEKILEELKKIRVLLENAESRVAANQNQDVNVMTQLVTQYFKQLMEKGGHKHER